jgi:hypothetical protein
LSLARLVRIIEVRDVNRAAQAVIGLGQLGDDDVDAFADVRLAFQGRHVGEPTTRRDVEQIVALARRLVRDVFHEQQDEDVVLLLRRVHAASQGAARLP